ncbi:winged helix-turn-helix domain-containing protein [Alteromonas sp. 1_MG-2023]|uniref:nSTAND1 domain-containing NTPase n=1 Tax=Alteromonas sp. 1_MG-2023 TaxID=3062669 RepID=UPI0026E412AE|nr:winged helix-turn-helix domain-containing protein [Alteromonas sp. 1_MG-2023]MDO6568647.1 winged helix-turn-helix domain-containing protein [Alteromonas sp. 1_MG-2023]
MLKQFYLGDWQVEPASNTLILGKTKRAIEPKAMDVLLLLCQQAGEVVSADDIVAQCWPDSPVGDNPIHKTITQLRKALGDKASAPSFIETIRKRGYRVIADVQFLEDEQTRAAETDWQGQSPFPGLTAFTQQESQVYYGRNAAVKNLLARFWDQFTKKRPFTLIIGPSGSGKSSLVHAGLLPRLLNNKGANGVHAIDYASIDIADIQAAHIVEELAACMLDWDINDAPLFEGESADSLAAKLKGHPKSVINIAKAKLTTASQYNNVAFPCYVIVLDRLEAYLATNHVDSAHKQAVFTLLETLAESGFILMLLVCRNDFYHHLAAYPTLMKNKERGAHFDVTPPSASELSQMIRLPAIAAGLEWEEDSHTDVTLDDIILTDAAAEPNCLPLLQYTLQELYLQRTDNLLQVSTYKQLGGIEGAIGHKAEQLYLQMSALVKTALDRVLPLIVTLTQDGSNLTSRTAFWSELSNDNEKNFVELMVEHRLFVSQLYQDKACFKVAHEAVLRRWQRVQDWIQQHQSALVSKGRLEQQTRHWLQDNKSNAFLLTDGKPLTDALALKGDTSLTLTNDELALIRASQKTVQRKRVIRGVTLAALACLTIISFGAMLQSQQSQQLAERKRLEAENLMGYMIGDFADKLRSVKRMDLLEGISEQALHYVEQAQQSSEYGFFTISPPKPSFELRFQHALSLQAMAEVRFYRDDLDTAKEAYEEADVQIKALLSDAPNHFELLKTAGANAFWLGHIAYNDDLMGIARTSFERYLTYSERMLAIAPDNTDAMMEVAYAQNSLGSLEYQNFEFSKSIEYFSASLKLKQYIAEQNPDDLDAQLYAADTLSWIASATVHTGKYEKAYGLYEEADEAFEKMYEKNSSNAAIIEPYVALLVQKVRLTIYMKHSAVHTSTLEKAYQKINTAISQDPNNSEWKADLNNIEILLLLSSSELGKNIDIDSAEQFALNSNDAWNLLYLVEYYQLNSEWSKAGKILANLPNHDFENSKGLKPSDNFVDDANKLRNALARFVQQSRNNNNINQTLCENLKKFSASIMKKTSHPGVLLPYLFSIKCTNKKLDSNNHHLEKGELLAFPYYFNYLKGS